MKSWTMRVLVLAMLLVCVAAAHAQSLPTTSSPSANPAVAPQESHNAAAHEAKSEANLVLPDLGSVAFFHGAITGQRLLLWGLLVCLLGMLFGLVIYVRLKNMPVHRSMREISELIYETCKTYLVTQGKFIAVLWIFIAIVMVGYFGALMHYGVNRVVIIVLFSIVGILGSYGVAWFGIRINTFANSRAAFASLGGKPFPTYEIPLKAGMSIGMLLISVELDHALHPALRAARLRRPVLHRLRHR